MPTTDTIRPLHRLAFAQPAAPRRTTLPDGNPAWLFSRYTDVRFIINHATFRRAPLPAPDADTTNLVDAPDAVANQHDDQHLRLRRAIQRAFSPRAIARMAPWVAGVVDQLLDTLVDHGPSVDLVTHYTQPLPIAVMRRLTGVHEVDDTRLLHWAEHAFAGATTDLAKTAEATQEFTDFTIELLAQRRRAPGPDLISSLVQAADDEGGITEPQLVNLVSTLVVGGHDTAMTMLSNSLLYLLDERPEVWARLGSDEAAAGLLTERMLHLIPLGDPDERPNPLQATEDIEVGGVALRAGEIAVVDRAAANRDPAAFSDDPFSDLFAPLENPTLAFGGGRHYCPGTWLARTELQLGLHRLAARLPGLHLTTSADAVEWRLGTITRSPLHLPATW
ncbi:cytochrome P450 [Streptomyces pinistramenti]|uniref:cytochrome P450 n=1 Tax=Streptomyces pinistramenti TaxID=2884812 RepID=UPI001D07D8DB|nr:cytochrome P450 [Streptomyces pinistramenti]MCB5906867.1 cytochrome P450 [Streptomyces pinistramenti]